MQHKLFDDGGMSKHKGLTISKAGKQTLSKNQQAFNRLTQKIEKLQKEIAKKKAQFDLSLKMYAAELYPVQMRLLESRYKLINVLWQIYKNNKLSKTNQRHLKSILQHHLQQYFEQTETEPDSIMQDIFSELEGISYAKMMQQEKEIATAEMEKMFESLDVDMEGVDIDDEAAMAEKIAAAKEKLAAQQEEENEWYRQQKNKKNKTAKQVEAEKMQRAVDEMKQKNISTIYRQLAKLFHPDLEQDEERKLEKEILMKALTAAYEAKNLHALLTLELKWIHNENDHLESLTEEKLTIYLTILKEQAQDLEVEKLSIFQQPQYVVLAQQFGFGMQQFPVETLRREVKNAKSIVQNFESDIAAFESDLALRHVNAMIKQWLQQEKEMDEDKILRMLLG